MKNMKKEIENALNKNKAKVIEKASPSDSKNAINYMNEVKYFESERIELAKKNALTAWKITALLAIISVLSIGAVIGLTPLKTVVPFMLLVNETTGQTQMISPLSDKKSTTYGEALDKYWLNRYVIERNSYRWEDIQYSYNVTKIMSSYDVFSMYNKAIQAKNSPVEKFAENKNIEVKVKGVTFQPDEWDTSTLAIVYFTRRVTNKDGQTALNFEETEWRATIVFDYNQIIQTEQERFLNPLGFNVLSYREDRITN